MKFSKTVFVFVAVAFFSTASEAFAPRPIFGRITQHQRCYALSSTLFDDDEVDEMVPIAENYLHAKYKQIAASHGHVKCDEEDARDVLRAVLPPVTPEELDSEVNKTMELILKSNSKNTPKEINEDDFVKAILKNTYWQQAGPLVVKELIYFDALYAYYSSGASLLNNNDYEALKESLAWEGSSVATMNKNEALFVTAVASSKRGQPIMDDTEYIDLKKTLTKSKSWVTARGQDALERLGIDSFLGYLHRAL